MTGVSELYVFASAFVFVFVFKRLAINSSQVSCLEVTNMSVANRRGGRTDSTSEPTAIQLQVQLRNLEFRLRIENCALAHHTTRKSSTQVVQLCSTNHHLFHSLQTVFDLLYLNNIAKGTTDPKHCVL